MQAVVAAGFRIEEYAMIRVLLDELHAEHVKVIIGDHETLLKPQSEVLDLPEIDWAARRGPRQGGGGGWGSQRAILFSGLSIAQQVRISVALKAISNGCSRLHIILKFLSFECQNKCFPALSWSLLHCLALLAMGCCPTLFVQDIDYNHGFRIPSCSLNLQATSLRIVISERSQAVTCVVAVCSPPSSISWKTKAF
jgi:hypothetical protein